MKVVIMILLFNCAYAIDTSVYINYCSPHIALNTMSALIKTESNFNPLAININNRGKKLKYQAQNIHQAISWVDYLEKHNYNFDVGLAQINIVNIHAYGYKASDMLEPCINLHVAEQILLKNYAEAKKSSTNTVEALYQTLSAYNSGNYTTGFKNGYVEAVINNAYKKDNSMTE